MPDIGPCLQPLLLQEKVDGLVVALSSNNDWLMIMEWLAYEEDGFWLFVICEVLFGDCRLSGGAGWRLLVSSCEVVMVVVPMKDDVVFHRSSYGDDGMAWIG